MNIFDFAQSLLDGILFGATYSIIGVGFAMIFGVMRRINLAYGATAISGAYLSVGLMHIIALPAPLVFLSAAVCGGLVGFVVYTCCFRFIPQENRLASLLATVGGFILMDEIIVQATNGMPQSYPALFNDVYFEISEFYGIRGDLVFIFVLSILTMFAIGYLLKRSKLGIATRAVAQQPVAACLCGISIEATNISTFVITGIIGGLSGAMIGASVGLLSPLLISPITIKGLVVTVIGGLGSIPGAIIAGFLVGALENIFEVVRGVTERDMYVMALLFIFLALRPYGIFPTKSGRD